MRQGNMTHFSRSLLLAAGTACLVSAAFAKLPPPTPEAAAKAAEAAAKTAWAGKVDAYKLCQAQDRTVAHYRKTAKDAKPAAAVPPCADPGPFAYTPPADKPLESSGAHSPPGTASSPPSTNMPAASAPKS
jgi:hypothetical protein